MRYIKWVSIMYFAMSALFIFAQGERETDTVYIASYFMTPEMESIVISLEARLAQYDIYVMNMDLDEFSTNTAEYDLHLYYDQWWDAESDTEFRDISIHVSQAPLIQRQFQQISPLLDHSLSLVFDANYCEDEETCFIYNELLLLMALYSIDRCDLVEEPLQVVRGNIKGNYFLYITEIIRANCLILNGDYDQARMILHESYWITFGYPIEGISNLAWLYIENGEFSEANSLMDTSIQQQIEFENEFEIPHSFVLGDRYARRARVRALTFNYDGAIEDIDNAIELFEDVSLSDESLAPYYTLRGEIIFLIYEWDRVLENFNTALELAPAYAPAYFQRGVLYYTMTERENALADFQHYLELAPDGQYAEQAQQYIDSIQLELDALGG